MGRRNRRPKNNNIKSDENVNNSVIEERLETMPVEDKKEEKSVENNEKEDVSNNEAEAVETTKTNVEETTKANTEEPVVEQKPQVQEQPKKEQPDNTNVDIRNVTNLDELLNLAEKDSRLNKIASRLKRYKETMSKLHDERTGASANYDMYHLLMSILKNPDYAAFKVEFDFINKVFLLGRKDVFSPVNLSRYDYRWVGDMKSYKIYHRLVELISKLAKPGERHEAIKATNFEKGLLDFPEVARHNLVRYYGVSL